jgi:hypothetical protein
LAQIDTQQVRSYKEDVERARAASGLGAIMETLGRHSRVLLANPDYGKLICNYVATLTQF